MTGARPLSGRRVLVTREHPGELATLLAARGATPVHVPLIRIDDPSDGGVGLRDELDRLHTYDWLVVTSVEGAERVAPDVRHDRRVRLGAVGAATAAVLAAAAQRTVEVVPAVQRAEILAVDLIAAADATPQRFLLAVGNRAATTLADALRTAGHEVTVVTAYRTALIAPDLDAIEGADALTLASGSAARSWVQAVGAVGPPVIVAIGPSTAAVAHEIGLKITGVAADHHFEGLVTELERHFRGTHSSFRSG